MITRLARGAVAALSIALLASCSSAKPQQTVTVTVPPAGDSSAATAPGSAAVSSAASSGATPSPAATTLNRIDGTCESLLPDPSVTAALGGKKLTGADAFVVGQAEKDIGRVSYLNCRYGLTGAASTGKPKLEIGISLYKTAGNAAARISATTDDYTAHGATPGHLSVSGKPAALLTGGVGAGYTAPLLVVASGQRTVAVSIDPAVAKGSAATRDATAVAQLALKQTGG